MDEQKRKAAEANLAARKGNGGLTWVEAARVVLERYDEPVPHKEILRIIQDENLRTCVPGKVQLACLNAMLNANCRGSNAIFYRAPGQHACFGMKKNLPSQGEDAKDSNKVPSNAASPATGPKVGIAGQQTSSPLRSALTAARAPGAALRVMPPKKRAKLDESDVAKLSPMKTNNSKSLDVKSGSKQLPKKTTSKFNASRQGAGGEESVAVNPASFRLEENTPQENRQDKYVCLQKNTKSKGDSLLVKFRKAESLRTDELVRQQNHVVANKKRLQRTSSAVAKARIQESEAPSSLSSLCVTSSTSSTKEPSTAAPGFLEVKFKRLKKMNHVDQLKRTLEGKVDLMTPESILTSVEIKSLINLESFTSLPAAYQYQLLMLLPSVDRKKGADNVLRISNTAVNNEFFAKSCQEWRDKLADGDFNTDIIQKIKQEGEKDEKLDPWKREYFEPSWGKRSVEDPVADSADSNAVSKSSWDTFLNFAENSGKDHVQDLLEMQTTLRQQAEAERLRKIAAISKSTVSVKASKGKQDGGSGGAKSRSKRALKKAQMLQIQLKEAKAKVVAEARSGSKKVSSKRNHRPKDKDGPVHPDQSAITDILDISHHSDSAVVVNDDSMDTAQGIRPGYSLANVNSQARELLSAHARSLQSVSSRLSGGDGVTPPKKSDLRRQQHANQARRKPVLLNHTRENSDGKTITSRILCGSSIYSRGSTQCPCNMSSMTTCTECGAFCHQDCMGTDKRCTLCTAAC